MRQKRSLEYLSRRARRRHLANLALAQAVQALTVGAAGFVLLLIAGAQVLDWPWVVSLFLAAAALGVVRVVTGLPKPYAALQGVDRRLGFHDTLSTAFYYQALDAGRGVCEEVRAAQFRQAERLALQADLQRAVPIAAPRSIYVLAALITLAAGLFALRYGVSRRLDLRPPLAAVLFPDHSVVRPELARARKNPLADRLRQVLQQLDLPIETGASRPDGAGENLPAESPAGSETASAVRPPDLPKPIPLSVGSEPGGDDASHEAPAELSDSGHDASGGENSTGQAHQRSPESLGENSNLLEQFREALASLMDRLKLRSSEGNSQIAAGSQKDGAGPARPRQRPSEKGGPGPGRQSEGDAGSESDGEREPEASQRVQSASGKSGGRDTDLQPAREGRSGIGSEDGNKEAREAEQLAAMGKITELFGRRQATLTGEVTVEVASGTQKLRTPYSHQEARHVEAGGDVHRDEVPLLFQHYVQRYFEEVRRLPRPAPASETKPANAAP